MTTVLWDTVWPDADIDAPVALYVRADGPAEAAPGGGLVLAPNTTAQFDTYFNGFSATTWLRHTNVTTVVPVVDVDGPCTIRVTHRQGNTPRALQDMTVNGPRGVHELLPIDLQTVGHGRLAIGIQAGRGPVVIHEVRWTTTDEPTQPIRLGMVITTFNRHAELGSNIGRLDMRRQRGGLSTVTELVLVDNAKTLPPELRPASALRHCTVVIPNTNCGGAGGFARGLIHLRSTKSATHALFMDDDVAFHPQIVDRASALLEHATNPTLSIAGAMLSDDAPGHCFEAGARYFAKRVYPIQAVGKGDDLTSVDDLQDADARDDTIDYAAWWFHAFPIDITDENPLPVFLRGDDVAWGLMHTGRTTIATTGIGLWHQGFELKNGPHAWFYDTRNFAIINTLVAPGYGTRHQVWRYLNITVRSLLSFKYASAEHITAGMNAYLDGPAVLANVDHAALDQQVRQFDIEHIEPLPPEHQSLRDTPAAHGLRRYVAALASILLLAGHLQRRRPDSLTRVATAPLQSRALGASLRHDTIIYRNSGRTHGFVVSRDNQRFRTGVRAMLSTVLRLVVRDRRVARAYRANYPSLISDRTWHAAFKR